jgi:predicted nucleotidyltransferase
MTVAPFDPLRALRVLRRHRVRFVLIGGLAGRLRGSPTVTNDIDLCYARDGENLERLARALRELGTRLRGVSEEVPFLLDARTLKAGDHFTFATKAGNLDCLGFPAGSGGYEALASRAETMDLGGVKAPVSSLDDLIRMKRAAARPKDLIEAEVLTALKDEIDRSRRR